ncbi:MAG: (d)CMP kinase [Gammaproteobacteria bacterium]|nr:(d)CMP kinase [Gammaproteobacteria bacterium]
MQPGVPVLAIDGPSGSGKGTIARRVASVLGWHLLDSGALYRLAALAVSDAGAENADDDRLADIAGSLEIEFEVDDHGEERIIMAGNDVTAAVRDEQTGLNASRLAAVPAVREALLALQVGFRRAPGLVADGRDMGTQVFPDAGLKVFLTASPDERARRRYKQLKDKGIDVSLPALSRDIEERDRRDAERSVAPLKPAADARVLDSSDLSIDEVVDIVLDWTRQRYPEETEY